LCVISSAACGGGRKPSQPARRREMPSLGLEASPSIPFQFHPGTNHTPTRPHPDPGARGTPRQTTAGPNRDAAVHARGGQRPSTQRSPALGRRGRRPDTDRTAGASRPAARHQHGTHLPSPARDRGAVTQNPQARARRPGPTGTVGVQCRGHPMPGCRARTGRRGDRRLNASSVSADPDRGAARPAGLGRLGFTAARTRGCGDRRSVWAAPAHTTSCWLLLL
jgi:hypothetical protein